eukprot:g70854.t1
MERALAPPGTRELCFLCLVSSGLNITMEGLEGIDDGTEMDLSHLGAAEVPEWMSKVQKMLQQGESQDAQQHGLFSEEELLDNADSNKAVKASKGSSIFAEMEELQEENGVDEALGLDNVPLEEEDWDADADMDLAAAPHTDRQDNDEDWNAGMDIDLAATPHTDSGSEAEQSEQSAASSQSAPVQHTQDTAEEPHHQSLRDVLMDLFFKHDKKRLPEVDSLLKQHQFHEKALFEQLFKTYPTAQRFPVQNTVPVKKKPAKAKQAAHSTAAKTTQADKKDQTDQKRVSPLLQSAPTPSLPREQAKAKAGDAAQTEREKLIAFYQTYAPDKVGTVDEALKKYKGQEAKMWTILRRKYKAPAPTQEKGSGKETPARAPAAPPATKAAAAAATATKDAAAAATATKDAATQAGPGEKSDSEKYSTLDNKAQLISFYHMYAPDKVSSVDVTLARYKGQEDKMWKLLRRKYQNAEGAKPADTAAAQATKPADTAAEAAKPADTAAAQPTKAAEAAPQDHRARLVAFYKQHAPEKLSSVDQALAKYKGQEKKMFDLLYQKYCLGGTKAIGNPYRERLVTFYKIYAPDKLHTTDAVLRKFQGREEAMFKLLEKKYSNAAGKEEEDEGHRDSVSSMDGPGIALQGRSPTSEKRRSPDRRSPETSPDKRSPELKDRKSKSEVDAPEQPPQQGETRARLVEFLGKYAPHALSSVDAALIKYKGREVELFQTLRKRFATEIKAVDDANKAADKQTEDNTSKTKQVVDANKATEKQTVEKSNKDNANKAADKQAADNKTQQAADNVSKAAEPVDYRKQLVSFLTQHAPDKLHTVDKALAQYKGKEEAMFAKLRQVYGVPEAASPQPSAQKAVSARAGGPTSAEEKEPAEQQTRAKLLALYQKYNPEKQHLVDRALQRYAGRTDQMFQDLYRAFGLDEHGQEKRADQPAQPARVAPGTQNGHGGAAAVAAVAKPQAEIAQDNNKNNNNNNNNSNNKENSKSLKSNYGNGGVRSNSGRPAAGLENSGGRKPEAQVGKAALYNQATAQATAPAAELMDDPFA